MSRLRCLWKGVVVGIALVATPLLLHSHAGSEERPLHQRPALVVRPMAAATVTEARETVVEIEGIQFLPETVTIRAGETIEWRNGSKLGHTVTADPEKAANPDHVQLPEGAATFDSGDLAPGETYRRTFDVPGTYQYFCIPHEAAGMVGTIVVKPAE